MSRQRHAARSSSWWHPQPELAQAAVGLGRVVFCHPHGQDRRTQALRETVEPAAIIALDLVGQR
jgi:hypothetical protein